MAAGTAGASARPTESPRGAAGGRPRADPRMPRRRRHGSPGTRRRRWAGCPTAPDRARRREGSAPWSGKRARRGPGRRDPGDEGEPRRHSRRATRATAARGSRASQEAPSPPGVSRTLVRASETAWSAQLSRPISAQRLRRSSSVARWVVGSAGTGLGAVTGSSPSPAERCTASSATRRSVSTSRAAREAPRSSSRKNDRRSWPLVLTTRRPSPRDGRAAPSSGSPRSCRSRRPDGPPVHCARRPCHGARRVKEPAEVGAAEVACAAQSAHAPLTGAGLFRCAGLHGRQLYVDRRGRHRCSTSPARVAEVVIAAARRARSPVSAPARKGRVPATRPRRIPRGTSARLAPLAAVFNSTAYPITGSTARSTRATSCCAASTTWPERRGERAAGPSRHAHAARTPFRRCSDGRREAVAHVCRRNVSARPRSGSRPPRAGGRDAEQGARGHRLLLGDQGALHDRGRDRRGLPLRQPRARARPHDGRDVRRADRGPDLAVPPPVRARRLLARGRPHQHRRHAGHGQPHGRLRRQPAAQHGCVRDRARRSLRGLVRERAHAFDPHDRDAPARGLLLACRAVHLRARHGRGRFGRGTVLRRLLAVGGAVRGGDRRRLCPAPDVRDERDPRVLARVHPHAPARRVDRRLPLSASRGRRPRPWDDGDERALPPHDPGGGRLPDGDAARPDRGADRARRGGRGAAATGEARVLVVANKVAVTSALVDAVRGRAALGPARFFRPCS